MTAISSHSCKEFIEKYDDARVTCVTCKRWNRESEKCREESWVGEWLTAEYEESAAFTAFGRMMSSNTGVWIG